MGFAKDAIQVAARDYEGIIWAVANLADMPLSDHTCNIILNILSPANASEFPRVLSNNGLLIKVVPGKSYLQELRYALYGQTQSRTDTERKLSAHMPDNFMLADVHNINYQVTVVQKKKAGREIRYKTQPDPLLEVKRWLAYYDRFWDNKLASLKYHLEQEQKED